mmetsp:Transcript_14060/g.42030  ORF Transcript_14060/g.42030 Transcript_14060/m.42030 type:complete len:325 (-) Transcript_14060:1293-2267(-)|eukprot:CAMPEP_0118869794 /NCGR_PEP_ID=MMETSP1163-20130328/13007_1 /TAXON_ID=124430 /ORGANISM="Phaeomonas parva, Strain CCMP2877" /LENGTH=324 /DNA_ID=CAMNT_0006804725 /DNA_START=152 /DNA_END=1126 /DNA_ORIENTATION=+
MDAAELDRLLGRAKLAAREAGSLILTAHRKRGLEGLRIESKGGVDLVTATDKASEKVIFAALHEATPHYQFVGEEGTFAADGPTQLKEIGPEPTWVVDPLDGTTNFVHGVPLVCVCIGLLYKRRPVLGVVYNPIQDELYEARVGGGARCNGRPIRVSGATDITEALIVNNIGASRSQDFTEVTLARLAELMGGSVRGLRNFGSAAANMCYVASGVLDAYFEDGYGGPWDVVAAAIIVEEAGGAVTQPDGSRMDYRSLGKGKVLCGNAMLISDITRNVVAADKKQRLKKLCRLGAFGPIELDVLHVALAVGLGVLGVLGIARARR